VRPLFGQRRVRQGVQWGSGSADDVWRKRGHEQGGSLPTGGWCTAGSGPRPAGAGDMRGVHAASRTEGEGRG
jgi:hypothetical protein